MTRSTPRDRLLRVGLSRSARGDGRSKPVRKRSVVPISSNQRLWLKWSVVAGADSQCGRNRHTRPPGHTAAPP